MILFRKAFHIPKITHQYSRYYRADRLVPLQQSQKLNVNNLLQLHEFSKNIPSDIISLIIFPFYRIPLRNYFYYLLFSWNSLVKDQGTKKKKKKFEERHFNPGAFYYMDCSHMYIRTGDASRPTTNLIELTQMGYLRALLQRWERYQNSLKEKNIQK